MIIQWNFVHGRRSRRAGTRLLTVRDELLVLLVVLDIETPRCLLAAFRRYDDDGIVLARTHYFSARVQIAEITSESAPARSE